MEENNCEITNEDINLFSRMACDHYQNISRVEKDKINNLYNKLQRIQSKQKEKSNE